MHDQVKLLLLSKLEPGAGKREIGPGDLGESEDFTIEALGSLEIADGEAYVVDGVDIHSTGAHPIVSEFPAEGPNGWPRR